MGAATCGKTTAPQASLKIPAILAFLAILAISVFHVDQEESAGGRGGCGGGSVTQFENAANVGHGEAAFADQQKGPDQVAHHVMEKSAAAHGVDQLIVLTLPCGLEYGADIVDFKSDFAALRIDGGEAGEVMLAFHQRPGFNHARFVERVRMVINIARLEWRTNCSTTDVVAIRFGDGGSAGVKFQGH